MTRISRRTTGALILLAILAIALFIGWKPLKAIYLTGVPDQLPQPYLYIPTGATFEQVIDSLQAGNFLEDVDDFLWLAEKMQYIKPEMRAGRFEIQPGWTNRELIRHLRAGKQAPVKLVLTNERLPENVAAKVARFIEADSAQIMQTMNDPALLNELGYTPQTLMSLFIPNTYEVYWTTTPADFMKRMKRENDAFWNKDNRLKKAETLNLTPAQVYTLASIVERETNHNPEKPTIAGVYLNRLKVNMPLQADPTAVFATRDFGAKRVTQYHTSFDSPYNTYLYKGLPPGPISMAGIPSIDAVLNPEEHNYLYFCAKADESGTHAFAATLSAHNVNAQRFWAFMKSKGL